MIHYASFRYDGENYLAFGVVKDYLPVFVEHSHRRYGRHGKTRWPSWAKFMHGDVDNYEDGTVSDLDELERRYGAIPADSRIAIAIEMRNSRWTDNPFTPPDASSELLEWYDKRDEAIKIWRETGDDTMAIEIGLFPSKEEEEELEQMEALEKLEADPDFTQLGKMLVEFDALAVLGVSRREEAHSNVLAWLLNPQENHSLGDFFLKKFLLETGAATNEQLRDKDWSNTEVRREWHSVSGGESGALDILVMNEDAKFVCGIENKVFSGEHSGQLTRYRKALKATYKGLHRSHLFLTRHGDHARLLKEQKCWKPVAYGTVLQLIKETLAHGPRPDNDEVIAFLRQYEKTLRRRIVPETEMRRMADNLYLRHRKAIDLIIQQKEAHIRELGKICKGAIKQRNKWHLIGEKSRGKLIGFVGRCWKDHKILRSGTGWGGDSGPLLTFLFDLREVGQLILILAIEHGTDQGVRERLLNETKGKCPKVFDHRGSGVGEYRSNRSIRLYTSEPILTETDIFGGDRSSWQCKVEEWVTSFIENEYPEMNKIILDSLKEIEANTENQPSPSEDT